MNGFADSQVINGTWGECWFDGQYMAETTALKAEINIKYTSVTMTKRLVDGQKMTGLELKGEVKFHKVSSFITKKMSEFLKLGKCPSFTIISKLDDPDAMGAERIACYGCKLDKVVLADWEAGKNGEESYSFTYQDWELLDTIN